MRNHASTTPEQDLPGTPTSRCVSDLYLAHHCYDILPANVRRYVTTDRRNGVRADKQLTCSRRARLGPYDFNDVGADATDGGEHYRFPRASPSHRLVDGTRPLRSMSATFDGAVRRTTFGAMQYYTRASGSKVCCVPQP
jgi:hypothetical protein